MTPPEMTERYSPPNCPHVVGRYSPRAIDPETQLPAPQRWEAECTACGEKFGPAPCDSGMVRQHISAFAQSHFHRNPLGG